MGDVPARRSQEIAALRRGLDLGMCVIDTAEMYGQGRAEELVGEAISGRRREVFLVSKVLPDNATRQGTVRSCEASLRRLNTDYLDLYLLHWRGWTPFEETLEAFNELQQAGKILGFGVSNLDRLDMEHLWQAGGQGTQTNQLLYNPCRRGIEWDLLPWMRERGIPTMAYSPLEQGRLLPRLEEWSRGQGMTPAQACLGWLLGWEDVLVIPKSSSPARVEENAAARPLTPGQREELEGMFPPPTGPRELEML